MKLLLSLFAIYNLNIISSLHHHRLLLQNPDNVPGSPAPPPVTGHDPPSPPTTQPPPPRGMTHAPTRPPIMGHFGQDCTPAPGDFPDQCADPRSRIGGGGPKATVPIGGILTANIDGDIVCTHNHDCCGCGAMICGEVNGPYCNSVICNGDSSCFGVKNIVITGDPVDGALISCNGDVSCMQTEIMGTNIAELACTGDFSCAYCHFDIVCLNDGYGCPLSCVGDDSCKGHFSGSVEGRATFKIENSHGMFCAHDACRDADFKLINNMGGIIRCGAEAACVNTHISVQNVESLVCGGEFGCYNSDITIINPQEGFSVTCTGMAACRNLQLELIVKDPKTTSFRGIACTGHSSCKDIRVTITKAGREPLILEELACQGIESCTGGMYDLTNTRFDTCGCAGGATRSCEHLIGIVCDHRM